MNDTTNRRFFAMLAALTAAAVFVVNCFIPLGVAVGVLYVVVVWLAYLARNERGIWITAGVCSLLTVLSLAVAPHGSETWKILANRGLALFAIWATAVPCVNALRTQAARAKTIDELRLARRFGTMVEAAPTAIAVVDRDGKVVLVNSELEKLFGYGRVELCGQVVDLLVPERFRPQHPAHRDGYFANPVARRMGTDRQLFARRKDGSEFPVELGLNSIETEEGRFVLSTIVDMTERNLLVESQRLLNAALQERTAALAESNEALAKSNVELQQFAYIASHDLQAPLRGIAGFAQFLQQDYHGKLDDTADEYIGHIVEGTQRMQRLINDLLTYSRIGSKIRALVPTNLADVFDDALLLLESEIEETGGEVTRGELPTVTGDSGLLSQLLQNLIGNALKYHGDRPPRVHVTAERSGNEWTVAVRDNGIGIDAKHYERIFEIFRRLHTQEQYPGTGIGLAVCRRIVLRLGGRIWVESEVGCGSTFRFTLPNQS